MKTFSLVIPVYQNSLNLPATLARLESLEELLRDRYKFELVLVDDGSTDASLEQLYAFQSVASFDVLVAKMTRNFGQTPAIQAGLALANGDAVGIISADLQEPPEVFDEMLGRWEEGNLFIVGERIEREEGIFHSSESSLYWRLVRKFIKGFPPLGYDCCLLARSVVNEVNQINEKNSSIFVLLYWLGYSPTKIPIVRKLRQGGKSQWTYSKKISFTIDTLFGFTPLPARIVSFVGIFGSVVSFVYLVYLFFVWLQNDSPPEGWLTVVGLVVLMSSMILFSIGLVSEYLLRILDESRKRPPYIIERITRNSDKAS